MSNNTGRRTGEPNRSQPPPSHSSARGWAMRDGELESPTYSSHPPTSTSSAHPRPPPAPNPFISSSSSSFPHPYTGRFERKLRTEMQGTSASGPPSNQQPPSSSSERSSGRPSTATGAHTSSGSPSPAYTAPSPSSATPSSSSSSTSQSAGASGWVPKPSRLFDGGLRSALSGQRPSGTRPTGSRVRFSDDGEEGEVQAGVEVQFEVSMDVDVAEEEEPEQEDAGDRVKEVPDDTPADVAASPSNANIRPQPPAAPRPPPSAQATTTRPTKTTGATRVTEKTTANKPPPSATRGSAPAVPKTSFRGPTPASAPAPPSGRPIEPSASAPETFGRPSTSSRPQPQPSGRPLSGSPTSSERSQQQPPKPAKRSKTTHSPGDQQPRPPTSSTATSTSAATSTPTRGAPPSARPSATAPVPPLASLLAPAPASASLLAPAVSAATPPDVAGPTVSTTSMAASSSAGPSIQPVIPPPATVDANVQQPPQAAEPKSDQQDQRSPPDLTPMDVRDGYDGSSKLAQTQLKEDAPASAGGKEKKRKRAKADDVPDEQPKKSKLALSDVLNVLTDADESTRQKDAEIARLRAENDSFKDKQMALEGRLDGAKRLVSTFKDGFDQLRGTVSAISDAKAAMDDKNRRLEEKVQGLRKLMEEVGLVVRHDDQALEFIHRQQAALIDLGGGLRAERDEAVARAAKAEESTGALKADLARTRAELDSRAQRVASLEADVDKKGGTITSLALQLKDGSQDELKVRKLQDQLDQATDRASTAEKQTADAEASLKHERADFDVKLARSGGEASRLRDQVADLKEDVRAKAAAVESSRKDAQTAKEAFVKARGLIAELEIVKARAEGVEGELGRVQAAEKRATTALQAERRLLEDTKIKQRATDEELVRTRVGLREARDEISGLATQLKAAEERSAADSNSRVNLERTRDQLENEVKNIRESQTATEAELAKTRADLEHSQAELVTLQREVDQATSRTAEVDDLRAQIATMKARQEDVVDRYWDEQLDEHEKKMVLAISDTLEGIHETESDKRVKLLEAKVADLERDKADLADRLNGGMDVDEEDDKENRRPVTRRGDELSSSCPPSEAGDADTDRVPSFKLQHRARAPSPGASSDAASPPPAQHRHQLLAHTATNEDMDDSSSAIEALDQQPQPRSRTPVESSSPLDLSSPAPASASAALALGPADQEHPIVITSSSPASAFKSYEGTPLPRSSSPPAEDDNDEMAMEEQEGAEMPPPAASPAAGTEGTSRSGEGSVSGSQPSQKTGEEDEDVRMEEAARPSLKVVLRRTTSLGDAVVAGGSQEEARALAAGGEDDEGDEEEDEPGAEPAKGPSPRRLRNGRVAPTTAPIIRTNSRGKKLAAPTTTASTSAAAAAATSSSAVAGPSSATAVVAEQQ